MNDWTSGYVADIGYTFGYYTELNPLRIKLAFLNAGLVAPEIGTACELGFGQGLSINMHAAASVVHWSGTDFNPAQASFAKELALVSQAGLQVYDESFEQYCARVDLPEFDFIGLHGIWTWVSDENRKLIVDFIKRKLKVGGVVYISYNTQPGYAAMVPMRDLLIEHSEVIGSVGEGIVERINSSLEFAGEMISVSPRFSAANPQVKSRIESMREQNKNYVAHEYFNRDWEPMPFSKMAEWLKPAKLDWACSASYTDAVDALSLTEEQQKFLKNINAPMFRETVRDFCTNQQFRKDYWVKGARRLSPLERAEKLRELRIILGRPRSLVSLKIKGVIGDIEMNSDIYLPILRVLEDYKIKTIGQIEKELKSSADGNNINFGQLLQAILILTESRAIYYAQADNVVKQNQERVNNINSALILKARSDSEILYLASPVTGGAIQVGRFNQLFIQAINMGLKQPEDWAKHVWQILNAQGQRIIIEEEPVDDVDKSIQELTRLAEIFKQQDLPHLKALKIL